MTTMSTTTFERPTTPVESPSHDAIAVSTTSPRSEVVDCIRMLLVDSRALDAPLAAGEQRLALQLAMLALTGTALFGAVLGLAQDGLHALQTAVLLPATVLLATIASVPAVAQVVLAAGDETSVAGWQPVALRVLAVGAAASVVLVCTAPVLLLALAWSLPAGLFGYVAVGCATLAFGIGLRHLLPPMPTAPLALRLGLWLGSATIVAFATVHAAWIVAPA